MDVIMGYTKNVASWETILVFINIIQESWMFYLWIILGQKLYQRMWGKHLILLYVF